MTTSTSYDDVLYPGYVHPQTHPDRLAVLATLFGMAPAPVPKARILELACGQGGNLIPLATAYPESRCLGIDLSSKQINQGREVVAAVGLNNIELRCQSILDFPIDDGKFDYIIAHGVFSWVPENVRDKILQICRDHLAPQGVALVSYNTFPGWHQRRMIRDMMRFHTRAFSEPKKRIEQAKAFLTFMTKAVPDESAYGRSLHEEFRSLSQVDEAYLFHEQLEEVNEPKYFHEFAKQAEDHGLQYVSEIELSNMQLERYPPAVAEVLGKMNIIEREQYLDFLVRRTFRQTLLCHSEVVLDRDAMVERIEHLRVASPMLAGRDPNSIRRDQPLLLETSGGATLTIGDAITKTAFVLMGKAWPNSIPMRELQTAVRRELSSGAVVVQSREDYRRDSLTLTHSLVHAYILGAIDVQATAATFINRVSAKPKACPLARYQAAHGKEVTTRLHRTLPLDPISAHILSLLDGVVDLDEILERLVRFVSEKEIVLHQDGNVVQSPPEVRELLRSKLEPTLENFCRQALLVA